MRRPGVWLRGQCRLTVNDDCPAGLRSLEGSIGLAGKAAAALGVLLVVPVLGVLVALDRPSITSSIPDTTPSMSPADLASRP